MSLKPNSVAKVMILIILGAALQNIIWYFRLSNPELMREFVLYFEREGAGVFLLFNSINYVFITLTFTAYMVFYLLNKRKKRKFAPVSNDEVKE